MTETTDQGAEKRRYPRISCEGCCGGEAEYPFRDIVRNISRGGCFVESQRDLKIGDAYEFEIKLPYRAEPILRKGEVTWKLEGQGGFSGYGIKFLDDDPADAAELIDAIMYLKVVGCGE